MSAAGGGQAGSGGAMGGQNPFAHVNLDDSPVMSALLPHGMQGGFTGAKIASPLGGLMEAKMLQSFSVDNMMIGGEIGGGPLDALVEAFKKGMQGPSVAGDHKAMYSGESVHNGEAVRPIAGLPGGGGSMEIG